MIRTIIWDWNGTLLDDVDCCVATLNTLRARRAMSPLDREEYRRRFGFPVRAFYEAIGFDFDAEDFAQLSRDFIAEYRRREAEMRLAIGARDLMTSLAAQETRHLVVSAMEARLLGDMLLAHELHPLLAGYHGRDDHSAGSKVEHGTSAVRRLGLDPGGLVVIGDTLHDLDLARAIGCRAVLYAGGHQSRARLAAGGVPVMESFAQLADHLGC
jgi:phosphoglycolate phosphatase